VAAPEWEQRVLRLNLTRQQVEQSPAVDTQQPVSREHEAALMQYYNWPVYWGAAGFPDAGLGVPMVPLVMPGADDPALGARQAEKKARPAFVTEDYHLRSVRAITGDMIEALDGSLGHVDDFLIEDDTWAIRYLVVDTRNWWPGKKVLIATNWIDDMSWKAAKVRVGLTRDEIKSSPAFDPEKPLAPEYLDELHRHYGKSTLKPWGATKSASAKLPSASRRDGRA
jgi:hypothetical protein